MATRMPVAVLLAIIVVNGCHSRDFIARNVTQQTTTVNDILQQQMLDNLAIFAKNKDALPSLTVVGEGSAEVTDTTGVCPTLTISTAGLPSGSLGANRSQAVIAGWKLEPCVTAGRLARLRCAFQFAFSPPGDRRFAAGTEWDLYRHRFGNAAIQQGDRGHGRHRRPANTARCRRQSSRSETGRRLGVHRSNRGDLVFSSVAIRKRASSGYRLRLSEPVV